jgi:hypothetical protein
MVDGHPNHSQSRISGMAINRCLKGACQIWRNARKKLRTDETPPHPRVKSKRKRYFPLINCNSNGLHILQPTHNDGCTSKLWEIRRKHSGSCDFTTSYHGVVKMDQMMETKWQSTTASVHRRSFNWGRGWTDTFLWNDSFFGWRRRRTDPQNTWTNMKQRGWFKKHLGVTTKARSWQAVFFYKFVWMCRKEHPGTCVTSR